MHNLITLLGFSYRIGAVSVARWCNNKPFFTKMVLFYMHVCRKNVVQLHRKIILIWCNFKRFDTVLNSKMLLNLIRKMKYLTGQLQLVFVFALATPNSYILFLHCNSTTCYTVL